jgi:DNA-binding GntR family transcriptional regulator
LALGTTSARYGEHVPTPHYGQPRYRTIADELRQRIESGAIPPGTLLPSESALSADFRASRGTIRQAIATLREGGFVSTEHGRGTYANSGSYGSIWPWSTGAQTRQREIAADVELAALLDVEIGTPLIEWQTVTRKRGKAQMVVRIYGVGDTAFNLQIEAT